MLRAIFLWVKCNIFVGYMQTFCKFTQNIFLACVKSSWPYCEERILNNGEFSLSSGFQHFHQGNLHFRRGQRPLVIKQTTACRVVVERDGESSYRFRLLSSSTAVHKRLDGRICCFQFLQISIPSLSLLIGRMHLITKTAPFHCIPRSSQDSHVTCRHFRSPIRQALFRYISLDIFLDKVFTIHLFLLWSSKIFQKVGPSAWIPVKC